MFKDQTNPSLGIDNPSQLFKAQHLNLSKKTSATQALLIRKENTRYRMPHSAGAFTPAHYVPSTRRRTREEMLFELYEQEKNNGPKLPPRRQLAILQHVFPARKTILPKKYSISSVTSSPFPPSAPVYSPTCISGAAKTPIKVLVVDDSSLMRKVIKRILSGNSGIEIVGEAGDGQQALEQISKLKPDVITLDVHMPVMDGITALKHIIVKHRLPVIMLSLITRNVPPPLSIVWPSVLWTISVNPTMAKLSDYQARRNHS